MLEFIAPFRKAVAGFVVTAVVSWLGRKGITTDGSFVDVLRTIVEAGVGALIVWVVPNRVGAVERKK